jgi:uncharacterized repeat protein (TIGR02543 family)
VLRNWFDRERILAFSSIVIVLWVGLASLPLALATTTITFSESGLPSGTDWCVTVSYKGFDGRTGQELYASAHACTTSQSQTVADTIGNCDGHLATCYFYKFSYENPVILSGTAYACSTGCSGGSGSTSYSASYLLGPFNFGLSNSGGISVNAGSSGTNTINVALLEGTSQSVTLSCSSGLPSGTLCFFNPASGNPGFTSTLNVSTSTSTPIGIYSINVTGTNGTISRTTNFNLNVTYSVVFSEAGLQPSTNWCVTVSSSSHCTASSSLEARGLTGSQNYQYETPIGSNLCTAGCSGIVTGTATVSATYTPLVAVIFDDSPTNGGTITCGSMTYTNGESDQFLQSSSITCQANPYSGYQFQGWSGLASGSSNPLSINVGVGGTLTANFTPTLTMVAVTFEDSPNNRGTITCSAATYSNGQTNQFAQASSLTCTANAPAGFKFAGWGGLASGITNPVTFNVGNGGTLTANFTPKTTTAAPLTPGTLLLTALSTGMLLLVRRRGLLRRT